MRIGFRTIQRFDSTLILEPELCDAELLATATVETRKGVRL